MCSNENYIFFFFSGNYILKTNDLGISYLTTIRGNILYSDIKNIEMIIMRYHTGF